MNLPSPKREATASQLRALRAVRRGEVVITRSGCRDFDAHTVSGNSLRACERRNWVEINWVQRLYVLTEAGRRVLKAQPQQEGVTG